MSDKFHYINTVEYKECLDDKGRLFRRWSSDKWEMWGSAIGWIQQNEDYAKVLETMYQNSDKEQEDGESSSSSV